MMPPLAVRGRDEIPSLYLPAHTVLCLIAWCLQYLGKHSQNHSGENLNDLDLPDECRV